MRELERMLGSVCRAVAIQVGGWGWLINYSMVEPCVCVLIQVVEGHKLRNIDEQMLEEILGVNW